MSKYFAESELIINEDGSCFHLHLRPEQVADKVILVGDPGRVALVASHFDEKECEVSSREFHAITGTYKGKRITVQSTGIGCDNIDIVVNELDALKNIDFKTRTEKPEHTTLTLVRIGTCGGLQLNCPAGTFVASQKSIGFDGLINFYARRNEICDLETEAEFKRQVKWNDQIGNPYCVDNNPELLNQIAGDDMVRGITIACGGFYGPQGRELRAPLADPELNQKIEAFEYNGLRVNNFETSVVKVNDADGNPVEIGAIVVWQVADAMRLPFGGWLPRIGRGWTARRVAAPLETLRRGPDTLALSEERLLGSPRRVFSEPFYPMAGQAARALRPCSARGWGLARLRYGALCAGSVCPAPLAPRPHFHSASIPPGHVLLCPVHFLARCCSPVHNHAIIPMHSSC